MNNHHLIFNLIVMLLCLAFVSTGQARGSYETAEAFLSRTFADDVPRPERLKLTADLKARIKNILGHNLPVSRLRYWQQGDRTAWILDEIGKTKPITTGLVVNKGKLEMLRVLTFRESRGSEIRYPFFTDQFRGVSLIEGDELDKSIDGISGATLSVWAMKKLARIAIILHQQVSTVQP